MKKTNRITRSKIRTVKIRVNNEIKKARRKESLFGTHYLKDYTLKKVV